MVRSLTRRGVGYAGGLSGIAGFVDAIGYVYLGGYFVSFMSGNSTRAGVELSLGNVDGWLLATALILAFVGGVVLGTLVGKLLPGYRRSAILGVVTVALIAASIVGTATGLALFTAVLISTAMGAENTVYSRNGEVAIGLTYMTGTLVKIGQHLVEGFFGGSRTVWLRYLTLWAMISIGAVVGALAYGMLGLHSLWVAVAATATWATGSVLAERRRMA